MRRLLLILLVTAPLTGCQFLSAGEDVAIPDPFEGAGERLSDAGGAIIETIDSDLEAEEPFVGEVEEVPVITADLISSTDPEARTRLVQQSRIDPFAVLPIPLEPDPVVTPVAAAGNGGSANARRSSGANGGANGGAAAAAAAASRPGGAAAAAAAASRPGATAAARPAIPGPTAPPVRVQAQNAPLTRPSPVVALPRIPQPVIAPTISVSGVIQLGGEPYAIVSSSGEPERYVRVGDRLAGGSVRVKRIDTMAFEPLVILEENGIEVSRPVRSSLEAPAESPEVPVAALPVVPVPSVPVPQATLPAISTPTSANSRLPAIGEVPGSLLLLPPGELTSQVILPNMRISVLGTA